MNGVDYTTIGKQLDQAQENLRKTRAEISGLTSRVATSPTG
jgi:hypothetical protein